MYVCICVHVCMYTHTYIYISMYVCIYACINIHACQHRAEERLAESEEKRALLGQHAETLLLRATDLESELKEAMDRIHLLSKLHAVRHS